MLSVAVDHAVKQRSVGSAVVLAKAALDYLELNANKEAVVAMCLVIRDLMRTMDQGLEADLYEQKAIAIAGDSVALKFEIEAF